MTELVAPGISVRRRRPPLVYASARAIEDARELLRNSAILETVVAEAIMRGAIRRRRGRAVVACPRFLATAIRVPGRVRERPRAWLVIDLQADNQPKEDRCR